MVTNNPKAIIFVGLPSADAPVTRETPRYASEHLYSECRVLLPDSWPCLSVLSTQEFLDECDRWQPRLSALETAELDQVRRWARDTTAAVIGFASRLPDLPIADHTT